MSWLISNVQIFLSIYYSQWSKRSCFLTHLYGGFLVSSDRSAKIYAMTLRIANVQVSVFPWRRRLQHYLQVRQKMSNLNTVVYFNKFNTMKRIERLFKNPKLKPSPTERMAVVALSLALIMLVSASGILTGSNSENNYDSTIDESFSSMPLVGILPSEMKKMDSFQDTLKKKKTIEVEMVDGKPVKWSLTEKRCHRKKWSHKISPGRIKTAQSQKE
jgi:hypothetical protein